MLENITAPPERGHPEVRKGVILLICAQLMIAINIVFAKLLLASVPLVFLLTMRFVLATCMLLPLHWLTNIGKTSTTQHLRSLNQRDWLFVFLQALCGGALFNLFMFLGLRYTEANLAGIIASALPSIIAIMAWLLLGVKISKKKVLCIASASVGLVVIGYGKVSGVGMMHSFLGDFLVLAALFPEALYYILCKFHPNKLPVFLISAVINALNGLIMLIALYFMPFHPGNISVLNWIILVVSALSSGLFYTFFFMGNQRVDTIVASLTTTAMPIATSLFAWLILNEDLNWTEAAGMGLVMLSIVFYAKR
jgi:drug/metabolite transporter (DMT)-like permease